jgi:hypothetical protein
MSEPEAAIETASEGEEMAKAAVEGSLSAGETGEAVDADVPARDPDAAEVIIGEIPDAEDLSHMLWTARCTFEGHGLLGTFDSREMAEAAKQDHLVAQHGHGG